MFVECARSLDIMKQNNLIETPKCTSNGNYEKVKCFFFILILIFIVVYKKQTNQSLIIFFVNIFFISFLLKKKDSMQKRTMLLCWWKRKPKNTWSFIKFTFDNCLSWMVIFCGWWLWWLGNEFLFIFFFYHCFLWNFNK